MHEANEIIYNNTEFIFLIIINYSVMDKDIICTVYNVRNMHYMTIRTNAKEENN